MFRTILGTTTAAAAVAAIALGASLAQAGPSRSAGDYLSGPFLGTYTGSLTLGEAAALGDTRMKGKFRLVLRANGTYTDVNPLDGPSQGGIYGWSVKGRTLALRLVSEGACTGRTQSLAWVVWHRK